MNRTILIGIIGAILLLLALLLTWMSGSDPQPEPAPPAATGEAAPSDAQTTTQAAAPETTTDPAPPQPTASPDDALVDPLEPTFDVVRIEPTGDTVIAGRAEPGSLVTILGNDADLGAVNADTRGEWVYLPGTPLAPGSHELKLKSELEDGRVILGSGTVVVVVPNPGQDVAGRATDGDTPQSPIVVLIPDQSKPGAEVLQKPRSSTATAEPSGVQSADGTLSVETIDYDENGNVSIAGRGPEDSTVLAYLDNALIGNGRVTDAGKWRIDPSREVAPGIYQMRLDAVRASTVIARLEIPFSRAQPLTDLQGEDFIVVQPGNSLWRIARRTLGRGFNYTVIYDANSDQIGDPDLIYPGQVFEVPKQ